MIHSLHKIGPSVPTLKIEKVALMDYKKDHSQLDFQINLSSIVEEDSTCAINTPSIDLGTPNMPNSIAIKNVHSSNILD